MATLFTSSAAFLSPSLSAGAMGLSLAQNVYTSSLNATSVFLNVSPAAADIFVAHTAPQQQLTTILQGNVFVRSKTTVHVSGSVVTWSVTQRPENIALMLPPPQGAQHPSDTREVHRVTHATSHFAARNPLGSRPLAHYAGTTTHTLTNGVSTAASVMPSSGHFPDAATCDAIRAHEETDNLLPHVVPVGAHEGRISEWDRAAVRLPNELMEANAERKVRSHAFANDTDRESLTPSTASGPGSLFTRLSSQAEACEDADGLFLHPAHYAGMTVHVPGAVRVLRYAAPAPFSRHDFTASNPRGNQKDVSSMRTGRFWAIANAIITPAKAREGRVPEGPRAGIRHPNKLTEANAEREVCSHVFASNTDPEGLAPGAPAGVMKHHDRTHGISAFFRAMAPSWFRQTNTTMFGFGIPGGETAPQQQPPTDWAVEREAQLAAAHVLDVVTAGPEATSPAPAGQFWGIGGLHTADWNHFARVALLATLQHVAPFSENGNLNSAEKMHTDVDRILQLRDGTTKRWALAAGDNFISAAARGVPSAGGDAFRSRVHMLLLNSIDLRAAAYRMRAGITLLPAEATLQWKLVSLLETSDPALAARSLLQRAEQILPEERVPIFHRLLNRALTESQLNSAYAAVKTIDIAAVGVDAFWNALDASGYADVLEEEALQRMFATVNSAGFLRGVRLENA